MDLKKDFNRLR